MRRPVPRIVRDLTGVHRSGLERDAVLLGARRLLLLGARSDDAALVEQAARGRLLIRIEQRERALQRVLVVGDARLLELAGLAGDLDLRAGGVVVPRRRLALRGRLL